MIDIDVFQKFICFTANNNISKLYFSHLYNNREQIKVWHNPIEQKYFLYCGGLPNYLKGDVIKEIPLQVCFEDTSTIKYHEVKNLWNKIEDINVDFDRNGFCLFKTNRYIDPYSDLIDFYFDQFKTGVCLKFFISKDEFEVNYLYKFHFCALE